MNTASTYQPTPSPSAEGHSFQPIGLVVAAILIRLAPPLGARGSILLAAPTSDGSKPGVESASSTGHEDPDLDDNSIGLAEGLRIFGRAFITESRRSFREGLVLYFTLLFHPIRSLLDARNNAQAVWCAIRHAVASLRETLTRRRSHD